MEKLFICILFSFGITSIFTIQSQNKNDYSVMLKSKIENYNNKKILSDLKADIDGDGIPDYVCIYRDASEQTMNTKLAILFSKNDYKDAICANFLPSQKTPKNHGPNSDEYTVTTISSTKKGIRVIISKENEKLSNYRRIVTFEYDKKNAILEAKTDGGVGVFGKTEKYVDVQKFVKEKITLENWDEWYSSLMCSSPTTLNNQIIFTNNEEDFINAIGNNTTIIIKAKRLNLSLEKISQIQLKDKINSPIKYGPINKDMGVAYADSAWWLENTSNLSIIGKSTELVSTQSKEYILWLNNCKNIELSNISIFHDSTTRDRGNGWNMCITNSSDITIKYTAFKSFGGVGLFLFNSKGINTTQSSFDGLENFAILVRKASELNFTNCHFYNNKSTVIELENAFGKFNNCSFFNNTYYYLIFLNDVDLKESDIRFVDCIEYNNTKRYDISNKLGYSYFYGLSDLDKSMDLNSGNVVINF